MCRKCQNKISRVVWPYLHRWVTASITCFFPNVLSGRSHSTHTNVALFSLSLVSSMSALRSPFVARDRFFFSRSPSQIHTEYLASASFFLILLSFPLILFFSVFLTVFNSFLKALREDEVVQAAHSLRSASSPPSTVMELPFQGADGEMAPSASALSPQGSMSMHDQPFDYQTESYLGESIPGSPGSSLHSSTMNPHASPTANARAMRLARGGVRDSASGSVMTSSSTYSEEL